MLKELINKKLEEDRKNESDMDVWFTVNKLCGILGMDYQQRISLPFEYKVNDKNEVIVDGVGFSIGHGEHSNHIFAKYYEKGWFKKTVIRTRLVRDTIILNDILHNKVKDYE